MDDIKDAAARECRPAHAKVRSTLKKFSIVSVSWC
jgi:hypothetical protein